jgi:hypothetical protein
MISSVKRGQLLMRHWRRLIILSIKLDNQNGILRNSKLVEPKNKSARGCFAQAQLSTIDI